MGANPPAYIPDESAPPMYLSSNTGTAPCPFRWRPARRAKFSRAAVKPKRLSERPQGASCAEGSDRPFFQGADVGGCSFLCFVSCLSGQEGNEDSNAAQSYRRKIENEALAAAKCMGPRRQLPDRTACACVRAERDGEKSGAIESLLLDEHQRRLLLRGGSACVSRKAFACARTVREWRQGSLSIVPVCPRARGSLREAANRNRKIKN